MSWMVNFEFLLHYCTKILGGVDSRVTVNQRFPTFRHKWSHNWSIIDEI
jgi:hypothetical protein